MRIFGEETLLAMLNQQPSGTVLTARGLRPIRKTGSQWFAVHNNTYIPTRSVAQLMGYAKGMWAFS